MILVIIRASILRAFRRAFRANTKAVLQGLGFRGSVRVSGVWGGLRDQDFAVQGLWQLFGLGKSWSTRPCLELSMNGSNRASEGSVLGVNSE